MQRDSSIQENVSSPYGAKDSMPVKKTRSSSQKKPKDSLNTSTGSNKSQKKKKFASRRLSRKEEAGNTSDINNSRSSSHSTSVLIRASVDAESLEKIHTFSLKRNENSPVPLRDES